MIRNYCKGIYIVLLILKFNKFMDKDSPRNSYPFLLKEDLFSTYLNQKNLNFPSDPWK